MKPFAKGDFMKPFVKGDFEFPLLFEFPILKKVLSIFPFLRKVLL